MIIKNLEGRILYKNRDDFEPDRIIDAIVKAGGMENVELTFYADDFHEEEAIKAIKFLKNINYDINNLPIEQYRANVAIELIRQGYDMYKIAEYDIPVITECGSGVLEECIKQGLDLNKFNVENHFRSEIEYDELGNSKKVYHSDISHFIRCKDSIDRDKFSLLADNGLINKKTLKDLEGVFGVLYYNYKSALNPETFIKVLNAYDKIELDEKKITELDFIDELGGLKSQLFNRYLETSENKDSAISEIYQLLGRNGGDIDSWENLPTLEVIKSHIKKEQNEIQEAFTHTAPKPSTRRRM
ncbi:hypothetical protein JML22_004246 [Salmonella enterica]|nr:hypothetical protein [Salmonella enterica]ECL4670399.1 hypothetical protein [Salmonella enterica]ECR7924591.1 hypothetical protein [Salmonella enterica]ECX4976243.1 hypothetical protein [Salmonella enterica]EDU5067538.1 hypothetical protein [Salmonella enterica]